MKQFCVWNMFVTLATSMVIVGMALVGVRTPWISVGILTGIASLGVYVIWTSRFDRQYFLPLESGYIGGMLLSPSFPWSIADSFISIGLIVLFLFDVVRYAMEQRECAWWTILHLMLGLAGVNGCLVAVLSQRPGLGVVIVLVYVFAMAAIMRFVLAPPERPCIGGLPDSA